MRVMFLIILIIQLQSEVVLSQDDHCGFDKRLNAPLPLSSTQQLKSDSLERMLALKIARNKVLSSRSVITIPVVVHVVWRNVEENISDERILAQIDMLNLVFKNEHEDLANVPDPFKDLIGNMNLNFCLAAEDPLGNPTSGIIRVQTEFEEIGATDNLFFTETGGSTAWDPTRYLNVWITGYFGLKGSSSFPEEGESYKDGIILKYSVVDVGNPDNREGNGRVAVHEIGHYLGLHHLWGDDLDARDTLCLTDDGFSDTPSQWFYNYRCPPDTPRRYACSDMEMYVNFMDYSPDECSSMFTQQQVDHMHAIIDVYRPGFLNNSISCMSPDVPADFSFLLYPNPTDDHLKIKMSSPASTYEVVELYDIRGIKLWSQEMFLFNGAEIEIPQLPNGIYVVRIDESVQRVTVMTN